MEKDYLRQGESSLPSIRATLIRLKKADLAFRDKLIRKGELGNGYHPDMEALHREHAMILNDIIDAIGYPSIDKVGQEASEAAWLVIQHAIGQPAFMKKCAKLLEKAVDEGKANPSHLAYLSDRIAAFEGKPQRFGTQFDWDEQGAMSPKPYDDLAMVNRRRAALGLNTLEEQTAIMREQTLRENHAPPNDHAERKRQLERWRKSVGWI